MYKIIFIKNGQDVVRNMHDEISDENLMCNIANMRKIVDNEDEIFDAMTDQELEDFKEINNEKLQQEYYKDCVTE